MSGDAGRPFLERLNPSEMFGDCMTELSYVECTASAVIALCRFRKQHPGPARRANRPRDRGRLRRPAAAAAEDGSWLGFWGINYLRNVVRG